MLRGLPSLIPLRLLVDLSYQSALMEGIVRQILVILICLSSGCASVQLRKHTVSQIRTVTDLQYQQVLDNLAMFVAAPDSMPFFSVPSAGGTSISTTGEASNTITWNFLGFLSDAFGLRASRTNAGSWTLAPINDPAKLQRMRCAYQIAVGYYTTDDPSRCIQCCKLLERWYPETKDHCGGVCRVPRPGWYSVGCERDVPKHACYVGHYCDSWVWVPPEGLDDLTRLTLTILDFATAVSGQLGPQASPPQTQQVVRKWTPNYDKMGNLTGYKLAEVTTTIPDEPRGKDGIPQGTPKDNSQFFQVEPLLGSEEALQQQQFYDRQRENYFNPVLPQIQLFRTP